MARKTALVGRSGALKMPPALVDGLLGYAVAMAVGVAVFTRSADRQPGPATAYLFALGFGLILLIRRQHPVLVLILTSLGICVYYTLQFPPIGLALPIAVALFSAADAGHLRISMVVSAILVTLTVYFQVKGGRDVGQLLGYELPPVIALIGASLALGDGARSRRLLKESQRERERQARLEMERRATDQRTEERLRLARDLHDALGHNVAMISLQCRDALTVTVRDDGQGPAEYVIGNGIRGMRERAAEWGGQLTVTSSGRDSGTVVTATLPWPESAETRSDA
jgi:signal transduction histidine kinase